MSSTVTWSSRKWGSTSTAIEPSEGVCRSAFVRTLARTRLTVAAEMEALEKRSQQAASYDTHPALLRLEELAALREMARNANARLYLDFNRKPVTAEPREN